MRKFDVVCTSRKYRFIFNFRLKF